jgi:hypothetical protein
MQRICGDIRHNGSFIIIFPLIWFSRLQKLTEFQRHEVVAALQINWFVRSVEQQAEQLAAEAWINLGAV